MSAEDLAQPSLVLCLFLLQKTLEFCLQPNHGVSSMNSVIEAIVRSYMPPWI